MPEHYLRARSIATTSSRGPASRPTVCDARDAGSSLPLDWPHLIEEIDSLGASERRDLIEQLLGDSPSLRGDVPDLMVTAWSSARRDAAKGLERHLDRVALPEQCPFGVAQVLDPDWFPEPAVTR